MVFLTTILLDIFQINVAVRIISAREATKRERLQYENEPR